MNCPHGQADPIDCPACLQAAEERPIVLDEIIDLAEQAVIDLRDHTEVA